MTMPRSSDESNEIVALVVHARDVRGSERHRFADALRTEIDSDGLLLETCHRVELYRTATVGERSRLAAFLPAGGQLLTGEAAISHAVAVAVGRDSVLVGEDQILHQLRQAFDAARTAGSIDPILDRLFATSLRAGRRARSWNEGPRRSLADVALVRIEEQVGPLHGRDVLIVGAGTMGRLAARAATATGASVAIANRSRERAADLARETRANVEDLDPGAALGRFAAIIVALGGPLPLGHAARDALMASSAAIVDLSVPPAIDNGIATVLGRRLTTADDLANLGDPGQVLPDRTLTRLDALIDATTSEFLGWVDGRERRAAARALVERANREREAALADLWRRLPDLDPEERATIEDMSRHLAERLLREPLERLGGDRDGRHERAIREIWAL